MWYNNDKYKLEYCIIIIYIWQGRESVVEKEISFFIVLKKLEIINNFRLNIFYLNFKNSFKKYK